MIVTYVSVWDGGTEISTTAEYNPITGLVNNIESTDDVDDLDVLDREYIKVDGEEIRVLDFDTFKELWLEQECNNVDSVEQYKLEINASMDFEDLFGMLGAWSTQPFTIRRNEFLKRNVGCYRED